jgi:serine/threonine-protein kinase
MCHSLSEAESIGLVHRDIKPANVFLCRYGEDFDFVKILDFGIAKAVHEPSDGQPTITSLTVDHVVQGTPAFIAPEQAMGSTVDGRADIYATGCVAYWLLTGELVFAADTPMRLMMHHAQTPPAAPSTRTELPVPADLDALILSCLAKDPLGRPQTARELAGRLSAIATAEQWSEERAKQWWHEHLAGS